MNRMEIYTIGFTKKTAGDFFEQLKRSGARRIVDVRLNNVSQLAGFAKKNDLIYFLKNLCGMDYFHLPELAPAKDMLDSYRKNKSSWEEYERRFLNLMERRRIEKSQNIRSLLHQGCLLCSEPEPDFCHRRLVVEYLQTKWKDASFSVKHL